MKTNHQAIKHCLSSPIKNKTLFASAFLAGTLLLTGCHSTSLSNNSNPSNAMAKKKKKKKKKKKNKRQRSLNRLSHGIAKKQRRQSFSYHSNIEINNEQQFANVAVKNQVASDSPSEYCEDTHDQSYAALL